MEFTNMKPLAYRGILNAFFRRLGDKLLKITSKMRKRRTEIKAKCSYEKGKFKHKPFFKRFG